MKKNHYIAIIGAGPAGCTLASLLAMRGISVVVFDDDKRPDLLVGESLIPAVVPILQKLGIEERIKEISVLKPGASFFHTSGLRVDFSFRKRGCKEPGYAYNVPRPAFDHLLKQRAIELGVNFISKKAQIQLSESPTREFDLCEESLNATGFSEQPSWLVDATGRTRLLSRKLSIPATKGGRNDVAYFGHFQGFKHDEVCDGQIIISVMEEGWSWRIPLKDKLSVGVVINKETAKKYGNSPEERLLNIIKAEPLLKETGKDSKCISKVMVYTNYQLISERSSGKGWILLGDAFGFVDPMLSPGLFMAMESASQLDEQVFKNGIKSAKQQKNLDRYHQTIKQWHESWSELIEYFYDGRILSLYEAGKGISENAGRFNISHLMEKLISSSIARMAAGAKTRSAWHRNILYYSAQHLAWEVKEPEFYSVKS